MQKINLLDKVRKRKLKKKENVKEDEQRREDFMHIEKKSEENNKRTEQKENSSSGIKKNGLKINHKSVMETIKQIKIKSMKHIEETIMKEYDLKTELIV